MPSVHSGYRNFDKFLFRIYVDLTINRYLHFTHLAQFSKIWDWFVHTPSWALHSLNMVLADGL